MSFPPLTLCGIALLCAVTAYLLRQFGWRGAPLVGLFAFLLLFSSGAGALTGLSDTVLRIGEAGGVGSVGACALRILGVGYLCGLTADVCRDLGEEAVARGVLMVGKFAILLMALPSLSGVLDVIMAWLG